MRSTLSILVVVLLTSVATSGDGDSAKRRPARPASQPAAAAAESQPAAPRRVRIGEIDKEMVGQWVSVRGTVEHVLQKPSRTRERIHLVMLEQDGKKIELVYWEDVAKRIPGDQVPVDGDRVRAIGQVIQFRNKLEIVMEDPAGVRKLKKKAD